MAGVRRFGLSGSVDTGTSGLAFIIVITSAMNVLRTSCVSWICVAFKRILSRMHLTTPMILSQEPPMCEECGELNSHVHPFSCRYEFSSVSLSSIFSSLHAPIKLVPLSDPSI